MALKVSVRHQANLNLLTGCQRDHLCWKNWVLIAAIDALEEDQ